MTSTASCWSPRSPTIWCRSRPTIRNLARGLARGASVAEQSARRQGRGRGRHHPGRRRAVERGRGRAVVARRRAARAAADAVADVAADSGRAGRLSAPPPKPAFPHFPMRFEAYRLPALRNNTRAIVAGRERSASYRVSYLEGSPCQTSRLKGWLENEHVGEMKMILPSRDFLQPRLLRQLSRSPVRPPRLRFHNRWRSTAPTSGRSSKCNIAAGEMDAGSGRRRRALPLAPLWAALWPRDTTMTVITPTARPPTTMKDTMLTVRPPVTSPVRGTVHGTAILGTGPQRPDRDHRGYARRIVNKAARIRAGCAASPT